MFTRQSQELVKGGEAYLRHLYSYEQKIDKSSDDKSPDKNLNLNNERENT